MCEYIWTGSNLETPLFQVTKVFRIPASGTAQSHGLKVSRTQPQVDVIDAADLMKHVIMPEHRHSPYRVLLFSVTSVYASFVRLLL
jgi:hypothetical protein